MATRGEGDPVYHLDAFECGALRRRATTLGAAWLATVLAALAPLAALGSASAQGLAGDPAHGQLLFQQRCGLCHMAGPQDGDGGQGPPLAGLVGRRAGTAPNFNYTDALKASDQVWSPAALDAFLAAPGKIVPGTAMPLSTPSAKDRADLIAYLSTVK